MRRTPAPPAAHGFTVVELSVTMLVLALVSVGVYGFLSRATDTTTTAAANVQAEADTALVLRTLDSDLRSATTIDTPAATCTGAGAFAGPPYGGWRRCVKVTIQQPEPGGADPNCPRTEAIYWVEANQLKVRRTTWSATCVATGPSTRTLLTGLLGTGDDFLTYYDGAGRDLLSPAAGPPTGAASIKVHLRKTYRNGSPPLEFTNVVALRNHR